MAEFDTNFETRMALMANEVRQASAKANTVDHRITDGNNEFWETVGLAGLVADWAEEQMVPSEGEYITVLQKEQYGLLNRKTRVTHQRESIGYGWVVDPGIQKDDTDNEGTSRSGGIYHTSKSIIRLYGGGLMMSCVRGTNKRYSVDSAFQYWTTYGTSSGTVHKDHGDGTGMPRTDSNGWHWWRRIMTKDDVLNGAARLAVIHGADISELERAIEQQQT